MLNRRELSIAMHRGRKTMQKYLDLKGSRFRKDKKKVQTDHALGILKIVTHFCKKRQFAYIIK